MEPLSHDRLRAWLGLSPGPWPPDHYALLGLAPGVGDLADIEGRVLDRMEVLRPHQLRHPELVTEGMNRLAQALVCLTDPVARAAYDGGLGIRPPPFEVVEDEPPIPGGAPPPVTPEGAVIEPGPRQPAEEQPRPAYEVVWEPEPLPPDVVPSGAGAGEPPAFEVVPDEPPEPVAPPAPAHISRRAVYRKLAALRRASRAWEHLRPVFGTPAEPLATPVAVLLCVRALAEARAALPALAGLIRGPGRSGGTVAALVRLPHALHTVRALTPGQREAVALDWRRGYDALVRERARLRELARAARRRRGRRAPFPRLGHELRRTPEWALGALALAALVFALLRRPHGH